MLVLSRKQDQEIVIDKNIRIRILSVTGGRVRIGIDAPKEVPICRAELSHDDAVSRTKPANRVGLDSDLFDFQVS